MSLIFNVKLVYTGLSYIFKMNLTEYEEYDMEIMNAPTTGSAMAAILIKLSNKL